jgi:hypothetical protein
MSRGGAGAEEEVGCHSDNNMMKVKRTGGRNEGVFFLLRLL